MSDTVSFDMISAAYDRIKGTVRRTPLLSSPFIDDMVGRPVFIKPECLQHTGSFKFRGASNAMATLAEEGKEGGVIAFSSGNHAQGVALAAKRAGREAVIIMPSDAPNIKIENTRAYGAEVILYDRANESREEVAQSVLRTRKLHLIKPFDDINVIAGQGTTGLEIAQDLAAMGIDRTQIAACTGGGGLTGGIAVAVKHLMPKAQVYGVEPEGFDDVARSLASGQRERNAQSSGGLWDAVVTPSPGEITFPILQAACDGVLIVDEGETWAAMAHAFDRLKIVAEPGGVIALAAALSGKFPKGDAPIVAVVSGGNVDRNVFTKALATHR